MGHVYLFNLCLFVILFVNFAKCAEYPCSDTSKSKSREAIEKSIAMFESIKDLIPKPSEKHTPESIKKYKEGYNHEDINLNITQILTKYNVTYEIHKVLTEDGYELTLLRVPGNKTGPVVYLQHGAFSSCDDWFTPGVNDGLGYILPSKGFDTWIGNSRGNKYSMKHVNSSIDCVDYWDFSWDEMGRYDLPATIDYILEKTKKDDLIYIGHSQGTTSFFVMASEKPEYNKKVSLMMALSPVVYMTHVTSPQLQILGKITAYLYDFLQATGAYAIVGDDPISEFFSKNFCGEPAMAALNCMIPMFPGCGYSFSQINYPQLPVISTHFGAGSALKQGVHFGQGMNSGRFCQFDNGLVRNLQKYKSPIPPEYPLEKITTPVVIFYSHNDFLANFKDVMKLVVRLPNVVEMHRVQWPSFNHMDYMFAKDVKTLINDKVLDFIEKHGPK